MPTDLNAILKLEVPVIVHIGGRSIAMEDVVALAPGVIVQLPKRADEELDILVNNKVVGTAAPVKVGENIGVRVRYVGDVRKRIAAMGDSETSERAPAAEPVTEEPAAEAEAEAPAAESDSDAPVKS
jgi:hypothetical protein